LAAKVKVKCDDCGRKFNVKKLKKKQVKGDIYMNYFACPRCNKEYQVNYETSELLELIGKREQLEKDIMAATAKKDFALVGTLIAELQKIKDKIIRTHKEIKLFFLKE